MCGACACAAISGLDGLDVRPDASSSADASVLDGTSDARSADGDLPDVKGKDSDINGCGLGLPCPTADGGCCSFLDTCGIAGCCKGASGAACTVAADCCKGTVCTNGGSCQSSCLAIGAACMGGTSDKCCRGQGYCALASGGNAGSFCTACLAGSAGCTSAQQCCSRICTNDKVCAP